MTRFLVLALLIGFLIDSRPVVAQAQSTIHTRRPVAIAVLNDHQCVTANHDSGTVSLVDLADLKVTRETGIGKQLSDVVMTPDGQRLLVTDQATAELIAVRISPTDFTVEKRLTVCPYPVTVRTNADGSQAYVASLWSRKITVVDLSVWLSDKVIGRDAIVQQIPLSFAPRGLLVVESSELQRRLPAMEKPSRKLMVADAFGPNLAVIDPKAGTVESVRELAAHAIRGLKLHPSKPQLMLTQQLLYRLGSTTFDDIHWGGLMANGLRTIGLADVVNPQADLLKHSVLEYIGGPERAAADPAGFIVLPDGTVGVAISGTDEFIVDDGNHRFSNRLKTEQVPTAAAITKDGSRTLIVNTLSDSITVVRLNDPQVVATISLGQRPELTAADRGELLFRSGKLSHDNWLSCASCHVDGHSNGLLNDNHTDGSFGTAKRVLTLRGVADTAPYAWNGRFATLTDQIRHSIQSTMQGAELTDEQISDLEAYLKTLPPPPAVRSDDKPAIDRGTALFESLKCVNCHQRPVFTSAKVVDVNLKDERGSSRFNPPSLRGVGQNGPYFHDGRAANLEAVFTEFRHQLERDLTREEVRDLVTFLQSL